MNTKEYSLTFIVRTPNGEQETVNDCTDLLVCGVEDCALDYKIVLDKVVKLGETLPQSFTYVTEGGN